VSSARSLSRVDQLRLFGSSKTFTGAEGQGLKRSTVAAELVGIQCRRRRVGGSNQMNRQSRTLIPPARRERTKHGLPIRQRETRFDGQFVRVVNSDYEEVIPGLWLPKQSRTQMYGPPDAAKQVRERPVLTCNITLCFWLGNQIADEMFDLVLMRPWARCVTRSPRITTGWSSDKCSPFPETNGLICPRRKRLTRCGCGVAWVAGSRPGKGPSWCS